MSDADCKPGYANEETGNKEPGCKPCEVGTYRGEDDNSCISCDAGLTTYDRGSTKASTCEALENPAKKFVAFASSFFMLSNAGGLSLEDHEDATPEECIVKCAQDPGCKAFDAGNDGRVPRAATFQRGDCFLSYDTEATIKERDVREVSQLMLYRKIDAQEQRQVFFRRTVDGFIKGNDAGGVFRNEHSPDACAQLCLDDINCVSFDAGRQYALKWDGADVSRGKEWQPHIDNCYLSYTTKDAVTKDRWEQPNCDKQTNPNPPFDPDCSNDDANGIDYYERIIPMFVEFDVEWSKLVNPQYFTWGKVNEFGEKKTFYTPLMNRPTPGDDGDGYGGGYYRRAAPLPTFPPRRPPPPAEQHTRRARPTVRGAGATGGGMATCVRAPEARMCVCTATSPPRCTRRSSGTSASRPTRLRAVRWQRATTRARGRVARRSRAPQGSGCGARSCSAAARRRQATSCATSWVGRSPRLGRC